MFRLDYALWNKSYKYMQYNSDSCNENLRGISVVQHDNTPGQPSNNIF